MIYITTTRRRYGVKTANAEIFPLYFCSLVNLS